MISNAFKGAYQNKVTQSNEAINTRTQAAKDIATLVIGGLGFSGALGSGALASAAQHTLAGRVGGIGGNIMLSTLQEKRATAQADLQNQSTIIQQPDFTQNQSQELSTVFEMLQKANKEGLLNKKGQIESSLGEIDPTSELGKKIIGGLDK